MLVANFKTNRAILAMESNRKVYVVFLVEALLQMEKATGRNSRRLASC